MNATNNQSAAAQPAQILDAGGPEDVLADFVRRANIARAEARECHRKVTARNRYYCSLQDDRMRAEFDGASPAELAEHDRKIAAAKERLGEAEAAWMAADRRYRAA